MGAVKGFFFMRILLVSVLNLKVTQLRGEWSNGAKCGTWYFDLRDPSSGRYYGIGGRLLYVPQTPAV